MSVGSFDFGAVDKLEDGCSRSKDDKSHGEIGNNTLNALHFCDGATSSLS